ncbi:ATP-dependent DNA helicase chl1 [Cryptotrichosporon argae]
MSASTSNAAASSSALTLPQLPTPETFAFPYPQPYGIQVELMRIVFRAIEERKIAIVESPTGTGKSLTLLTATLTWLAAHHRRLLTAVEAGIRERLLAEDPDDPPWVIEHAVRAQLADLRAAEDARRARLAKARERERRVRLAATGGRKKARAEPADVAAGSGSGDGGGERGDDEFLPDDREERVGGADTVYLSREVRELMNKYEATRPRTREDEEVEEDVPKIYYTSRTHTQLRQLTAELMKTAFVPSADADADADAGRDSADTVRARGDDEFGVSLVPLASRKQMCVNDRVRAAAKGRDDALNEACLDLQKAGKDRCPYLPSKADDGLMLDARDAVLATVKDIEDIVTSAKQAHVCPYYAARRAVKQAQIVTLPYNLLLQKHARDALGIDLTDQVIVIDEAHNLIDTLLSIYSTSLSATHLASAVAQLKQYLARFKARLKPVHALWIRQTLAVLHGLVKVCECFSTGATGGTAATKGPDRPPTQAQGAAGKRPTPAPAAEVLDVNALMARVGGGGDQVNLVELAAYLKDSKLARKVSGFSEKLAADAAGAKGESLPLRRLVGVVEPALTPDAKARSAAARHASIAAFHTVEAFLLGLTDARDDGRVVLSAEDGKVALRYVLLNPAERFSEVVASARAVVLAGGTMEPISDFFTQLFPGIPRDRFATLSCAHVIPKRNLLVQVVSRGPRKVDLEFKFANRNDDSVLGELGAVVQSTVGLVPDGVVVFLPSYAFLDRVKAAWSASGLLDKLAAKKQLFYEPQTSSDVEGILRDYALAISRPETKGALMFAVVGGKLSEGINFSDRLGRCVIMVGLPFANVGSVELQERMRYVAGLPGAGKDAAKQLYENLCMRAVNQSIGRAIRHANDYATILLVDRRFATARIRSKLPKWIGQDVAVPDDWSACARGIAAFFRDKRERARALESGV